jgi:hypothetical protein
MAAEPSKTISFLARVVKEKPTLARNPPQSIPRLLFALEAREHALHFPLLNALFQIGPLIRSHFALADAERDFHPPLLPIHL